MVIPIISGCPLDQTRSINEIGLCATVSWFPPTATDNTDGPLNVAGDFNPGDCFVFGATRVTYRAVDSAGNIATCSFDVRITLLGESSHCNR